MRGGGGTAPGRGGKVVQSSGQGKKERKSCHSLVKRKRAEKLVGGLPDNAGMLRAVAELTSVGFEGGVPERPPTKSRQILVLHEGSTISIFDIFDPVIANWQL